MIRTGPTRPDTRAGEPPAKTVGPHGGGLKGTREAFGTGGV
jgi:hypothetical protein